MAKLTNRPWTLASDKLRSAIGRAPSPTNRVRSVKDDCLHKSNAGTVMDDRAIPKRALVLIADDYDDSALLTAELIELSSSYETVSAKDGVEALELAAVRAPDAAILDIDMPRLNGMETARALRRAYPDRRILLIAATGGPSADLARTSGLFTYVFIKPYEVNELLRLLSSIGSDRKRL